MGIVTNFTQATDLGGRAVRATNFAMGQMTHFLSPCSADGVDTGAGCGVAPMPKDGASAPDGGGAIVLMPLFFLVLIGTAVVAPRRLKRFVGVKKERR